MAGSDTVGVALASGSPPASTASARRPRFALWWHRDLPLAVARPRITHVSRMVPGGRARMSQRAGRRRDDSPAQRYACVVSPRRLHDEEGATIARVCVTRHPHTCKHLRGWCAHAYVCTHASLLRVLKQNNEKVKLGVCLCVVCACVSSVRRRLPTLSYHPSIIS